MIIGVLKEVLEGEFRVAATPETVKKLTILKFQDILKKSINEAYSKAKQLGKNK